jgi:short-subunit dehydrogenase involved in D-alanine esterification of teichoic acids
MERDTSWDNPQLSDGDMPIRMKNAIKNTFPDMDMEVQKGISPQTQLDEFNDYLRLLADMDNINLKRKFVLIEGYIKHISKINL